MKIPYVSDSELLNLAANTTLGMESNALERTPVPEKKPLIACLVMLGIAILLSQIQCPSSITVIVAVIGVFYGGYWIYKKSEYNKKANRYKWITWIFECVGMVFRGELQDAKGHYACGTGNPNENIQSLKQTCLEMIVQKIGICSQPCTIFNNAWALNSLILLDDVLASLGDTALSVQASNSCKLIELLDNYGMNGNCLADSYHYGQVKTDYSRNSFSVNEAMILNGIRALESQCADATTDRLHITQIDAKKTLDILYLAAYANPPVSSDIYDRAQKLSQIAFGTVYDVLSPDAMLAHLIRCKCLSLDRANREISETRKWIDMFFKKHNGNPDFNANQFIYSFCGALKSLQLFDLEKACLETAEKNICVLNTELTARLDYLSRGGGRKNDKVKYYNGAKRSDTLPVDYDAVRMNTSDVEWLFNEALGTGGNNAYIDYALAYRVQVKKVTLPSSSIQLQGRSIASEIQSKLGAEAKISKVIVTALNSNETLQCLKIRTSRFPFIAYLLDISQDAQEIQIRLAICWIPISNVYDQQKQQCLSLWNRGAGEEMAYMNNILSAIENEIQRSIDKWNTAQPRVQVQPQSGQNSVYY